MKKLFNTLVVLGLALTICGCCCPCMKKATKEEATGQPPAQTEAAKEAPAK